MQYCTCYISLCEDSKLQLYVQIFSGLMETCDSNDQCYWGPEMVDKMECSLGVCACKYGYVKHTGRICVQYCKTFNYY